ncbi:glycoside hydrolase family 43 [Eubacterium sp. CAG:76]|nr:glycoside hydrolase family 43 [Eubacterium sp. CAG:76]
MWLADLGNGNYRNPILYADYSDPDAIRVGEDYFMVASSFSNSPALPILHSKDLVNWKVVNYCLKHIPEFRYNNPLHGCGVWAPSIRYHEGTYYVCFPMPDEGIYMTTTKDPFGEWSEPVNIRPGAGWIDPCPFWDDDGNAYLVAGVAKSRIGYKSVLHIVRMRPDGMGIFGDEVKIFDGNENGQITIEGPKMYKRNGYYYIFAPAGGVKTGWQTILRSKNPFGPYEYKVVLRQGDSLVNGPHQGAWVDTVTGEDWFLHFQDVYAAGRITHLQPMHWENDWPIIGINKEGNDYGEPVMQYVKPNIGKTAEELNDTDKYPVCEPDTTDEFDTDKMMLQWQWNSNYDDSWYVTKTDAYGKKVPDGSYIRLNALASTPLRPVSDYRNLLLQKWPAPEFECVTKMCVNGLENGDYAGIVSLGVEYGAVGIVKNFGEYSIRTVRGTQSFDCEAAYSKEDVKDYPIAKDTFADKEKTVYLRYTVKRTGTKDTKEMALAVKNVPVEEVTLEISFDGKAYEKQVSFTAKAGRWVGVKNGMFVNHNNEIKNENEGDGFVTADYIRYRCIDNGRLD